MGKRSLLIVHTMTRISAPSWTTTAINVTFPSNIFSFNVVKHLPRRRGGWETNVIIGGCKFVMVVAERGSRGRKSRGGTERTQRFGCTQLGHNKVDYPNRDIWTQGGNTGVIQQSSVRGNDSKTWREKNGLRRGERKTKAHTDGECSKQKKSHQEQHRLTINKRNNGRKGEVYEY